MTKKYAIIGPGGIGGYCAVKLAKAGFHVHCLLRSDYSNIKQQGLTLISAQEKINAPVFAYQSAKDMPICDVILVTLKTTENALLKDILPCIIGANSMVVILQNGIGMEEEIAEFVPPAQLIGGISFIKSTKIAPGIIHHAGLNAIELARYQGNQAALTSIAHDLSAAGIYCTIQENLATIRWKKLITNIDVSGLSVVLNATLQDLIQNPASFALLCAITTEVAYAAKKCCPALSEDLYTFRLRFLESCQTIETCYLSMKRDFDLKQPLELHAIYENTINLAKQFGVSMPLTEMLYQQLRYLTQ